LRGRSPQKGESHIEGKKGGIGFEKLKRLVQSKKDTWKVLAIQGADRSSISGCRGRRDLKGKKESTHYAGHGGRETFPRSSRGKRRMRKGDLLISRGSVKKLLGEWMENLGTIFIGVGSWRQDHVTHRKAACHLQRSCFTCEGDRRVKKKRTVLRDL